MTRAVVALVLLSMIALSGCATSKATPLPAMPFTVVEAGIPDLQTALSAGRVTSRQLVVEYLVRIGLYEDQVKAIITVNPKALEEAEARDRERASGRIRGPLHGIPVAIKDNIHTTDMPTTGGAVAFDGYRPPYEATIVKLLRDAGAIIIAKTVLTELANWVAGAPDPMPANYSGLAGYGLNPYDPRRDPRDRDERRTSGAGDRRIELGNRHDGELLGGQRRHRDLGLDPESGEPDRPRRRQAHGRTHQPLRHHPDRRRPGHGGADGAHGDRCRDPAGSAGECRAGSVRSGHAKVPGAGQP